MNGLLYRTNFSSCGLHSFHQESWARHKPGASTLASRSGSDATEPEVQSPVSEVQSPPCHCSAVTAQSNLMAPHLMQATSRAVTFFNDSTFSRKIPRVKSNLLNIKYASSNATQNSDPSRLTIAPALGLEPQLSIHSGELQSASQESPAFSLVDLLPDQTTDRTSPEIVSTGGCGRSWIVGLPLLPALSISDLQLRLQAQYCAASERDDSLRESSVTTTRKDPEQLSGELNLFGPGSDPPIFSCWFAFDETEHPHSSEENRSNSSLPFCGTASGLECTFRDFDNVSDI